MKSQLFSSLTALAMLPLIACANTPSAQKTEQVVADAKEKVEQVTADSEQDEKLSFESPGGCRGYRPYRE